MKTLKFRYILVFFTFLSVYNANAQKLPNVQKNSVWVPENLKIDGKANEWVKFQAHNGATNIDYIICNDNDYLYLLLQTDDEITINKIMGGGVTMVIQKSSKHSDNDGVFINYPVYNKRSHPVFLFHRKGEIPAVLTAAQADSNMNIHNNYVNKLSKNIRVIGMKDLDSLISIYNEDGVKAAQLFDAKNNYTWEMAVSLKNLGISVNSPIKFAYHILLNNGPNKNTGLVNFSILPDASTQLRYTLEKGNEAEATRYATTDFWGEYTLAKK